ncbi:MAG: PilZ domain-containing protein [Treponema sp.]|nr:PilZ domain-containing protein [Treponema sp.]
MISSYGPIPLQVPNISYFQLAAENLGAQVAFFALGVGAITAILLVILSFRKRGKIPALKEGYVPSKRDDRGFSFFTLKRISFDMGLDREQGKMLEFVMRNDKVTNLMKSFDSPALMDRHFKRAYMIIEQTAISEDELNHRLSVLFALRNTIETYFDIAVVESTDQIPEQTPAALIIGHKSHPTKVLSSSGDTLIVEHPVDARDEPISVRKGDKVSLNFFVKASRGFAAASRIVDTVEASGAIKLAHSGKVSKLSNRRFRRRRAFISARFYKVSVDSSSERQRLVIDKRQFVGDIMDISIGGCSIKTIAAAQPGQKIKVEFTKGDSLVVAALGQVIRTNRYGNQTIMHVKFLKIPRKSLNRINALVYEYAYI